MDVATREWLSDTMSALWANRTSARSAAMSALWPFSTYRLVARLVAIGGIAAAQARGRQGGD